MRKHAEFQRMVERLREASQEQGLVVSHVAAEAILADLVSNKANLLGVREETILRTYLSSIDVTTLATGLVEADEATKQEVANEVISARGRAQFGMTRASRP